MSDLKAGPTRVLGTVRTVTHVHLMSILKSMGRQNCRAELRQHS